MSGKRGSNPRPSAWEADALPTELLPHTQMIRFSLQGAKLAIFSETYKRNAVFLDSLPMCIREHRPFFFPYGP